MLSWFNARDAVAVGVSLADEFVPAPTAAARSRRKAAPWRDPDKALKALLRRAEQDARTRRLNLYQRARFANSFKWRLLDSGVPSELAAEVTRRLVVHLALKPADEAAAPPADPRERRKARHLFAHGNQCIAARQHTDAIAFYEACIAKDPRHAQAHNNLGAALSELGRYREAEARFREAVAINPAYPDPHANLGVLLHARGLFEDAVASLRRALKLKPDFSDARASLGTALLFLGHQREARTHLRKVLKAKPAHAQALLGLAELAKMEGRFADAEALLRRALRVNPDLPWAWAALAGLRRMGSGDGAWLERAEALAGSGLAPVHEATLRFAIGKFHDDTADYDRAFESFRRANELLKAFAEPYDRAARDRFVDDAIAAYAGAARAQPEGALRPQPVLVTGMMRSGTSLVEQILASHPAAHGAGELSFWHDLACARPALARGAAPRVTDGVRLAEDYLRVLAAHGGGASHVIDKAPVNVDYLGLIHAAVPGVKIICVRRDPADVCLSSYFAPLSPALAFTMDLADLAHYCRSVHRLLAHWRATLPPESLLEVPYAGLIADQAGWTRRILEFAGLDWHDACLDFHATERAVATASNWQVRQKLYASSVGRARHYAKFLGPLAALRDLAPEA